MQVDSPDKNPQRGRRRPQRHRQDHARELAPLRRRRHDPVEPGGRRQHAHRFRPRRGRAQDLDRRGALLRPLATAQGQPDRLPRLRHLLRRDPAGPARRRRRPPLHQRRGGRRGQHRADLGLRGRDRAARHLPPDQDGPRARRLRPHPRRAPEALRPRRAARPDPHRHRKPGFAGVVDLVSPEGLPLHPRRQRQGRARRHPGRAGRRGRDPPLPPDRGRGRDRRPADGRLLRDRHPVPGGSGDGPAPRRRAPPDLPA